MAIPCYTGIQVDSGWPMANWVLRLLLRSQQVPNVKSVGSSMSASFGTCLKHKVWKCLKKQAAYPGNMIVWSSIFPSKELHWSLIWLQVTSGRQKVLVGCKGPVEFQLESQAEASRISQLVIRVFWASNSVACGPSRQYKGLKEKSRTAGPITTGHWRSILPRPTTPILGHFTKHCTWITFRIPAAWRGHVERWQKLHAFAELKPGKPGTTLQHWSRNILGNLSQPAKRETYLNHS